jgi:lactoylglutathione lyase
MDRGANVRQVVPLLDVADLQASVRYYVDGLGFEITNRWVVDDRLRWCWLQLGGAALMVQEITKEGHDARIPQGKLGEGVSFNFICLDALAIYHDLTAREIAAERPFVGNAMWVTGLQDPDGYRLYFESPTDTPEGTEYAGEE